MARLSPATVKEIKNRLGNKCEKCRNKTGLQLHHIDKKRDHNVQSNLILLCSDCHYGPAHVGPLSKTKQKEIVKKRSKTKKKDIQTILRKWKGRKGKKEWWEL